MKVLFIIEDTYGDHDSIGVGILSAIAKKRGWETGLIIRSRNSTPRILERVRKSSPDVIAYGLATGEHRNILKLHRQIMEKFQCHFIFGGPHPTYCPEFINEDGVDTICIGEGEIAFADYLDKIAKNADYSRVNNLIVKKDGKIIRNPLNPLIEDLDNIPFTDRELFKKEMPDVYRYSLLSYTTRGCPYFCTYCSNPQFNKLYENKGKIVRTRSVNNVIEELLGLAIRPPIIMFYDDNFLIKPPGWLEEFVSSYGARAKIPFTICTSANMIKEPMIKALKEIGLRSVVYALETGNDEINKGLLKRSIKVKDVIEAGKVLKRQKIFTTLQNITLLPVADPFKLDMETLRISQKIRPTLAVSTPLTPYPGTEITAYLIKHGYLAPEKIDDIEKINKVTTILNFPDRSSMKKSLILHYFFDLIVHYPFTVVLCGIYSMMPFRCYKFLYIFYELVFAYKRYFLFLGVKFNVANIGNLIKNYFGYKFSSK